MADQPWSSGAYYQTSSLQADRQEAWTHEAAGKQQAILDVVQEPGRTRVTRSGRPKMRFNLDPPPILRLRYTSSRGTVAANSNEESENAHFKLNPRLFVIATLLRSHDGARERDIIDDGRLLGSTIASPHKLRNDTETASCNLDFEDGPLFVFGELSCTIEGEYKLEFNLYELDGAQLNFLTSTLSNTFEVAPPKDCSRRRPATHLSLACHNQGVRLKIRKAEKRKRSPGGGSDAESGQDSGNSQRHKFRRLVPNNPSARSEKEASESQTYSTPYNTARDDMIQQWIPSSRQTPLQSTPTPRQYIQDPPPSLLHPPKSARYESQDGGRRSEPRMSGPYSSPAGRIVSAPVNGYGTVPRMSSSATGINRYHDQETSTSYVGLGLTAGSWLEQRQKAPVLESHATMSPSDARLASKRMPAQPHVVPQSAFTFHYPGPTMPTAVHTAEWDCVNLNIPSPTGDLLPLHTDSGFGGSVFEGWSNASG